MQGIENKPEGKLMAAIFEERDLYPYIVVEEDGKERVIKLMEAVQEALTTLPLSQGKNDSQAWARNKRVLELRFGLIDGRPRTLKMVGEELDGTSRENMRRIEARALRRLRHPRCSKYLRRFFIPSFEEINNLWKEIHHLREENGRLKESNQKLREILKGCGVTEEELEGVEPENLASTAAALKEERDKLEALISRFPNSKVWNAVRRASYRCPDIVRLPKLREMVLTGEIRQFKDIGQGAIEFLQKVLQTVEQEASP